MKPKIALIVSAPGTFNAFYLNHIKFLKTLYDVTLIANFAKNEIILPDVKHISLDLDRKPSLIDDFKNLMKLTAIFKEENFDIVHSTTPKAGFVTQIAGFLSGRKIRLHTFTGQIWANKTGIKKDVLKLIDRTIARLSTHLLADSKSQMDFLISENIPVKSKIQVLGEGSISGVNTQKFYPKNTETLRRKLGFVEGDFVFLFIGRLNADKGIKDLLKSFDMVHNQRPRAKLLIVGPDEENLLPMIQENKLFDSAIFYQGFTKSPEDYMTMADIMCLPSYREGFGTVIVEASACGTPTIGSNIYGITDAIDDGKSGYLFQVGNSEDLAYKMIYCIDHPDELKKISSFGLQRIKEKFDADLSSQYLLNYYRSILA
ncbi:hypothetical protein P255_01949 [Acinetobacter brisouii CIP 110357]|uniref:Glycosyl transferase family 1 domain-containing protein n=1 Tax=Acinetobacter brisouii CIP 110357 TaxID=1341683 RepID=V2VUL3_9GAMM|nr:glycosyltransferase family 4 protein [Acinetobacter brisouii]ENV47592.1 hypothetical protein F954_00646 [Acinetobacter brisouii ANC 4119]ESK51434.1 hypothetical protein P255_01949 [Acinetobacter brisouii CIP 110357]